MSLTYTPINELPFAPNFEGNDYLLIWDISQPANQARRLTFTALASYLAYTNRQLDWNDITNKPASFTPATHTHTTTDITGLNSAIDARLGNLPNGAIIGGVAHFFQDTLPSSRVGGLPIQSGDRLIKPNAQDYFYDGLRWLTCRAGGIAGRYTFVGSGEGFVVESATLIGYEDLDRLWIEKLIVRYQQVQSGAAENASNCWTINLVFRGSRNQIGAGFTNLAYGFSLNGVAYPLPSATPQKIISPINQTLTLCDIAALTANCTKSAGVTSWIQASFTLITRGIHP